MLPISLAYFVTPHGFGHATRASAVMAALQARHPQLRFEIFTTVPEWVFADSVDGPFSYHSLSTDVGLVQTSPIAEDVAETVRRLDALLPFREPSVAELAARVQHLNCRAVLCDIAVYGIAVARAAGVPSILIENFTWDWIYEPYAEDEPRLRPHIGYLRSAFEQADLHIQTRPICAPIWQAFTTGPVARRPRSTREATRARLGVPHESKTVLLTMGGIEPGQYQFLRALHAQPAHFLIPGGSRDGIEREGNVVLLPHRSGFYHPDLMQACDVVVGKLGYSTLAEAYNTGTPYGYLTRPRFRETASLGEFVQRELNGMEIAAEDFANGDWLRRLPDLLSRPRPMPTERNGAEAIAEFVNERLTIS